MPGLSVCFANAGEIVSSVMPEIVLSAAGRNGVPRQGALLREDFI
jgi:hypothetical protein